MRGWKEVKFRMTLARVPDAVGFLEIKGAADGAAAVDTAVKAAVVEILQTRVVCSGKFTVLLAGGECADAGEDGLLLGASLGPQVTRSMMDYMQAQSARLQTLGDELAAVRATLTERKLVERAKGLLMEHQGLDEGAAYRLLRQTAMNQNRRLVDVAESVLSMADYLPDNP